MIYRSMTQADRLLSPICSFTHNSHFFCKYSDSILTCRQSIVSVGCMTKLEVPLPGSELEPQGGKRATSYLSVQFQPQMLGAFVGGGCSGGAAYLSARRCVSTEGCQEGVGAGRCL